MTKSKVFASAARVPRDVWKWPNFTPAEIACKGDGSVMFDTEAMDKLQALRDAIGRPLVLHSAYRSPAHNAAVGGAPRSRHMMAEAFDIDLEGHDPHEIEAEARRLGFHGIGRYPDAARPFIHVDIRPASEPATWGPEWPFGEDDPAPASPRPAPRPHGLGRKAFGLV